jgi:DNA-binding transcriptional LysR family regulator
MQSQLAAARASLGVIVASAPYLRTGLVPVERGKALAEAWSTLPVSDFWLVGHRALRSVPRIAAAWSFVLDRIKDATQLPKKTRA